jgi:uncharacterized protein (DUF342 family)
MDGQYDPIWVEKLRKLDKKISKLRYKNSQLRKALILGIENVERDIASDNFVGDDEHEFLRIAKIALREGHYQ